MSEGIQTEGRRSGAHSPARLNFDDESYDEARTSGLAAFRQFREALAFPEAADPSEVGPKEYRPLPGPLEELRRTTLHRLPGDATQLSLLSLARIGGHATWGDLEVFYEAPNLPGSRTPASLPLRDWYSRYVADFDSYFPEHRESDLFAMLDGSSVDGFRFANQLEMLAAANASATSRTVGTVVLLGVLLRDFASELRPLTKALNLSVDALVHQALLSFKTGDDLYRASEAYEELTSKEIAPGPGAMLVALGIVGIPELDFALDREAALVELANAATQIEPAAVLSHANSDQPTDDDQIGVTPLVEGLRALLDDDRTGLGLSIGITAPWGAGKSSIMRQLRTALTSPRPGRHRTWIPIRFDAWKYERSERLWAALSKAIYDQSLETMGSRQRAWFKFRLEGRRRGWVAFLLFPLLVMASLLALGVLVAVNVSTVVGFAALAATFVGFSGFAAAVWGLLSDPFKRALAGYTTDPIYAEQLGFTAEADSDIRLLTEQLTEADNRALVIFVDDLDRCSPGHVVEAVEAISQIFNASEESACVFILGIDRDVITASIEVAYRDTIAALPPNRQSHFGLHFLTKLVQLSVSVPPPDPNGVNRLLDSIGDLPRHAVNTDGFSSTGPSNEDRPTTSAADGSRDFPTSSSATDQAKSLAPDSPEFSSEAELPVIDQSAPEFHRAERFAAQFLKPNPREIKRFDNALRLQLQVARRTKGCGLTFSEDDLIAVARWVALRLRWPDLAVAIDDDPSLLGRLERIVNDPRDGSHDDPWLADAELKRLLQEKIPGRRAARLQDRTFLRIS